MAQGWTPRASAPRLAAEQSVGALVGNDVAIEIDLSLVRQPDYLRVAEALGRSVSG